MHSNSKVIHQNHSPDANNGTDPLTPSRSPVRISGPLVSRAMAMGRGSEKVDTALRTFSMVPLWYWNPRQTLQTPIHYTPRHKTPTQSLLQGGRHTLDNKTEGRLHTHNPCFKVALIHTRHQQKVDFTHTILASRWTSYTIDTKTESRLHTHNPCFTVDVIHYTQRQKADFTHTILVSMWTSYTRHQDRRRTAHTQSLL